MRAALALLCLPLGGCAVGAAVAVPAMVQVATDAVAAYQTYEASRRNAAAAVMVTPAVVPQIDAVDAKAAPLLAKVKDGTATPETATALSLLSAQLSAVAAPYTTAVPNQPNVSVTYHPIVEPPRK